MNSKTAISALAAVLLACFALLTQTTPSFASDNITDNMMDDVTNNATDNVTVNVNVIVEQDVTVTQTTAPTTPATPPAPTTPYVPPTPTVPPVPLTPPAPPPPPPPPAPPAPPVLGYYSEYYWPYGYRWSAYVAPSVTYISPSVTYVYPEVIVEEQLQPQVQLDPPPVINSFTADPNYIQPGQTVTLTWMVSDVLERNIDVTISPGIGPVSTSGSFSVSPSTTTTYTLTATNIDGSVSANTTVTVTPYVTALASTTATEDPGGTGSALTGGLSSGSGLAEHPWPLYGVLLALLAAGAIAITVLITRKPNVAYAGIQTGYVPRTETGTKTRIPHTTPAAGAKLMTSDGECIPVTNKSRSLGRNDFRSMVKPDQADLISREHLRIECKDDECYIEDRGSTNGTRVNGDVITGKGRHLLRDNDTIDLGGALTLTFKT